GEAKNKASFAFFPQRGCAREYKQLTTRLDAAVRFTGVPAVTCARCPVGIGFVDCGYLIDAVRELAGDRILEDARTLCRCSLHDQIVATQRMHREAADVGHAAARAHVFRAVPFIRCLLGFIREALAERVELEPQLLA